MEAGSAETLFDARGRDPKPDRRRQWRDFDLDARRNQTTPGREGRSVSTPSRLAAIQTRIAAPGPRWRLSKSNRQKYSQSRSPSVSDKKSRTTPGLVSDVPRRILPRRCRLAAEIITPLLATRKLPRTIHGWHGLYRHPMSAAGKPVQSSASTFKCLPARNISHPAGSNRGIMIISE